jgi:cation transporter-like permease
MLNHYEDLDTQPEKDLPLSRLISLSMGLVAGCGLILGGLIGALVGHFLLENALGPELVVAVAAIVGAIVVVIIGVTSILFMSSRADATHLQQSAITHPLEGGEHRPQDG